MRPKQTTPNTAPPPPPPPQQLHTQTGKEQNGSEQIKGAQEEGFCGLYRKDVLGEPLLTGPQGPVGLADCCQQPVVCSGTA